LFNFLATKETYIKLNNYILFRFQLTVLTCRTTVYILFIFWNFFFYFGESLFLLLMSFSALTDSVPGNYFFSFETHTTYFLDSGTAQLTSILLFYIIFFTLSAILYLVNLKYQFNYKYYDNLWYLDLFFLLVVAYSFLSTVLFILFILLILNFAWTHRSN
jgi:hypothetical protein